MHIKKTAHNFIDDPFPFMDREPHGMRAALTNAVQALGSDEFAEEFCEAEKKRAQEC